MTPGIVSTYGLPRERYPTGDYVWVKGVLGKVMVAWDSGDTVAVHCPGIIKLALPQHVSATGPILEVMSA